MEPKYVEVEPNGTKNIRFLDTENPIVSYIFSCKRKIVTENRVTSYGKKVSSFWISRRFRETRKDSVIILKFT